MNTRKAIVLAYLVLEARDANPENLQHDLQPGAAQLAPPLFQQRLVDVLEDPDDAGQEVSGRLLLQDDRTLGLKKEEKDDFSSKEMKKSISHLAHCPIWR